MNRKNAFMALNALPGIGPIKLRRIMQSFDQDPIAILNASASELKKLEGVGDKLSSVITSHENYFNIEREQSILKSTDTRFVSCDCLEYPRNLLNIPDAPIGLYVKGKYMHRKLTLAIVGTRQASIYGLTVARKLSRELANAGVCIVSGMARGIDGSGHEGALEAEGDTWGVLGCGINIIYPPEHVDLFKKMESEGTLISEFPFNRRADKQTFPRRNRIIAGMCDGMLVVESAAYGGSMISARLGMEYGKTVMAIPGRIESQVAQGCHDLIRDGAVLVTNAQQIVDELSFEKQMEFNFQKDSKPKGNLLNKSIYEDLPPEQLQIINLLKGGENLGLETLSDRTCLDISELSIALITLEISKLIKKRADATYEIVPVI
jgi:DNA processing protein